MDGLGQDAPATMKKQLLHSLLQFQLFSFLAF
jgi:hypothetical protein